MAQSFSSDRPPIFLLHGRGNNALRGHESHWPRGKNISFTLDGSRHNLYTNVVLRGPKKVQRCDWRKLHYCARQRNCLARYRVYSETSYTRTSTVSKRVYENQKSRKIPRQSPPVDNSKLRLCYYLLPNLTLA